MTQIDYLIVGAGINGVSISYFLQEKNKIVLIDKGFFTLNASSKAGAFLSPMIGLNSNIKSLIDKALPYSLEFYKELKLNSFIQNGLLKLPKNSKDTENFKRYKEFIKFKFEERDGGFFFPDGAIVNPQELFNRVLPNIDYQIADFKEIEYRDGFYYLGDIKATNVILTRGYQENFEEYLRPRAIWGQRISIKSSTNVSYNIHKNISISTTREDKSIVIGASHSRDVIEQEIQSDITNNLLQQAKEMIDLKDIELLDESCGVRSAGSDFMPILGKVIDSKAMLKRYPNIIHGERGDWQELIYHKNLYIINQVGGRGFVLAPYLAKLLVEHIKSDKEIPKELSSDRVFYRFFRKMGVSKKCK